MPQGFRKVTDRKVTDFRDRVNRKAMDFRERDRVFYGSYVTDKVHHENVFTTLLPFP